MGIKLCEDYTRKRIGNKIYLLPLGQALAGEAEGFCINSTGDFLWKELRRLNKKAHTLPEEEQLLLSLCQRIQKEYGADSPSMEYLQEDVSSFLKELYKHGILLKDKACDLSSPCRILQIGDLQIHHHGPSDFLEKSFYDFETTTMGEKRQHWFFAPFYALPLHHGKQVYQNLYVRIFETQEEVIFEFPENLYLRGCVLTKDGSIAEFFGAMEKSEAYQKEITDASRHVFFYFASLHDYYPLHSASLIYLDRLWLFSAPSGTGKSTHTNFWKEEFDTPLGNGDVNLLTIRDGSCYVPGIPWCGSSGIYTTKEYRLGSIFFLQRSLKNYVQPISKDKQVLQLLHRLLCPNWQKAQLERMVAFSEKMTKKENMVMVFCTNDSSAALTVKDYIDFITEGKDIYY